MRGHSGKNIPQKSRIVVQWTVGVVDAQGKFTQGTILRTLKTKYQRSKIVLAVTSFALSIGYDWPRLWQSLAQSLILGTPYEVPGLGQITWWIVMTKKMRGHWGKTLHRNWEIVVDWRVGFVGSRDSWLTICEPLIMVPGRHRFLHFVTIPLYATHPPFNLLLFLGFPDCRFFPDCT